MNLPATRFRNVEVANYQTRHSHEVAELESTVLPLSPGTLDYQLSLPSRFALTEIGLDNGRVVALFDARAEEASRPLSLRISVAPDARRQGLGGYFFERAMRFASECDLREKVRARLNDTDVSSLEWAKRRGFEEFAHRTGMARDLHEDADELEQLASEARQQIDVDVVSWASSPIADDWESLVGLVARCLSATKDSAAARGGLSAGDVRFLSPNPPGVLIASLDGVPAGLASISHERDRTWNTWFTGVVPESRGIGLARAMKLTTMAFARREGGDRITGFNDVNNAPILHLNESLGFERCPGFRLFEKASSS
ncbi:MAG TPA: GNAT family N-acetyltransferase [Acidimicrobiales bacterium]|nr:GNAT family N-acetyltransferase [Acidimicrobiales bacterium]